MLIRKPSIKVSIQTVATDMVHFNSNYQPLTVVFSTSVGGVQVAVVRRRGHRQLPCFSRHPSTAQLINNITQGGFCSASPDGAKIDLNAPPLLTNQIQHKCKNLGGTDTRMMLSRGARVSAADRPSSALVCRTVSEGLK